MNKFRIFFWSILILLLQILLFNNINFSQNINPYLYITFIFIFPLNKNRFVFLSTAFIYGLTLDLFSDTGGIHAASLLFVAFLRVPFVKLFFKKNTIDYLLFNLHLEAFGQVFNYVVTLTVIHHFILLSLDNFSFHNMETVLFNTLYSSTFTLLLYFLGSYILRKKIT